MKISRFLLISINFLLLGILLGACSSSNDQALADITPTPTFVVVTKDNYALLPDQSCLVSTLVSIQTDREQGTLISWGPDGHSLAYVRPENDYWGWYDGKLVIYNLDTDSEIVSKNIRVAGDVTWSPDGSKIAFIALHPPENRYTVEVMTLADGSVQDLYPNLAATDSYASLKGIGGWTSNSTLDVSEICGVDCIDVVEHNLVSGQSQTVKEVRRSEDTSLAIQRNEGSVSVDATWLLTNWSLDGKSVFFADSKDVAWIAHPATKSKFPLDTQTDETIETAWSPDSKYIAVRTYDYLFLFQPECKK